MDPFAPLVLLSSDICDEELSVLDHEGLFADSCGPHSRQENILHRGHIVWTSNGIQPRNEREETRDELR
jgi:hypothetical protein